MKLVRNKVALTILTVSMVCASSSTAQAGIVPWAWNVFFGPAHAPWFGPNNGGYRCYRPCRPYYAPRYTYAPVTYGCAPANGCATGGCTVASYSPGIVVSPVSSTGCGVVSSSTPAKSEQPSDSGTSEATDEAPGVSEPAKDEFNFDDPKPARQAEPDGSAFDDPGSDFQDPVRRDQDPAPFDYQENRKPVTEDLEQDGGAAEPQTGDPQASAGSSFVSTLSLAGRLSRDTSVAKTRVFTRMTRTSAAGQLPKWTGPGQQLTAKR